MRLLVTVGIIELSRQFVDRNGATQNVYNVPLQCGDDTFAAETFRNEDSQKRIGLQRGAIGFADLSFSGREFTRRDGTKSYNTQVTLRGFTLANQNIVTDTAGAVAAQQAVAGHDAAVIPPPVPAPQDGDPFGSHEQAEIVNVPHNTLI